MKEHQYVTRVIGVLAVLAWNLAFGQVALHQCATSNNGPIDHDTSGCSTSTPNEEGVSSCSGSCVTWDGSATTVYSCGDCGVCASGCAAADGDLTQYKYLDTCGGNTTTGGAGCGCSATDPDASSVDSRVITAKVTLDPASTYCF